MTDSTPLTPGGDIHRLLDEAFARVEMTPDAQDLKEEIRANLVARVTELEAAGAPAGDAAQKAIAELGDVRELVVASEATSAQSGNGSSRPGVDDSPQARINSLLQHHRVRPKRAFVLRVVVASAIAAFALLLAALAVAQVLTLPIGVTIALLALGASAVGWIVGDSLAQETTRNHPVGQARSGGYYLASALMVFGLGFAGIVVAGALAVWAVIFAAIAIVGSVALFAFLGATQTNRHKAWVLAMQRDPHAQIGNRFEDEPEAAARFGIYTVVIWILAFAAFLVLGFTVGWAWSWLALVVGLVVMMLTLARMLFAPQKS